MTTYDDFIQRVSSEKITLAHVSCRQRVFTFTPHSGNVHKKIMNRFVAAAVLNDVALVSVDSVIEVIAGTYFFDITNSTLYLYSTAITTDEIILTFKLFFSSAPINLSWDLEDDDGEEVCYEPRILSTSGININISEELKGMALIGSSKLSLNSSDGYFNSIFEKYVWENQSVKIYSFNRDLAPSDAKIIYNGLISNKTLNAGKVDFTLKDYLKILDAPANTSKFSSSDDVIDEVTSQYKRRIFGRVDGMKLQSIDMMGSELELTGTISIEEDHGTGTVFTSVSDLNIKKGSHSACGTKDAGLAFGGLDSGSVVSNTTEKFNGESWEEISGGTLNTARFRLAGSGTQSAALAFGGLDISSVNSAATEKFNGSTWSASGSLNTARSALAGSGTQSAALAFGGSGTSISVATTEKFNGSTQIWSASGNLNVSRHFLAGGGVDTSTISVGGNSTGATDLATAEKFNGSTWSIIGSLTNGRSQHCNLGSGSNLVSGGSSSSKSYVETERYDITLDSWFVDGALNLPRKTVAGSGDVTGSTLTGFICGGLVNGEAVGSTEIVANGKAVVKGVGSNYLSELSIDDSVTIGNQSYKVADVYSDNSFSITDLAIETTASDIASAILVQGYEAYNRKWFISPKILSEVTATIVKVLSTTKLKINDASNFNEGDYINIDTSTNQQRLISKVVYSENIIEISTAFDDIPTTSNTVFRPSVQSVYLEKRRVPFDLYDITNNSSGCYITFASTFERDFVRDIQLSTSKVYIQYSEQNRRITVNPSELEEQPQIENLKSRDWVKFDGSGIKFGEDSDWISVLKVKDNFITTRELGTTDYKGTLQTRRTNMLTDDSIISVDAYGETIDSTTSSTWIKNAAQLYKKMITELGYSNILNTASFDNSSDDHTLSLTTPETQDKDGETLKALILRLNESVGAVLTVDDELNLKYFSFNTAIDFDNLPTISNSDVISWKESKSTPPLYSKLTSNFRKLELNYKTESDSDSTYTFDNEYVTKYIELENEQTSDRYVYNQLDASNITQRDGFLSTLTPSVYTLKSDIRYQNLEIGNLVLIDFLDVANASIDTTKKIAMVVGVKKSGEAIELKLSDLGNVFNRRAVITPDDAADYSSATTDEKLIYSYITEDNGLLEDDENTFGKNLII